MPVPCIARAPLGPANFRSLSLYTPAPHLDNGSNSNVASLGGGVNALFPPSLLHSNRAHHTHTRTGRLHLQSLAQVCVSAPAAVVAAFGLLPPSLCPLLYVRCRRVCVWCVCSQNVAVQFKAKRWGELVVVATG